MDYAQRAREVIEIEMEGLRQVVARMDGGALAAAVGVLLETLAANRKIIVTGVGKSGHIGHKIAATLTSTGAPSVILDTVNAVHGDLGVVTEGDAVLALSYSGETEELLRILPALKRRNVRIIAITGKPASTLAVNAEVHLDAAVSREACPLNLAPTASTTAMLALGDALAMVLLDARGVTREDFAQFHPGGSIGRQLLLRVSEIMRPADQLVILGLDATVQHALELWGTRRSGAVLVIDADGRLAGIFTHGDFIRGMLRNPHIAAEPLVRVMTPRPITVRVDKLAAEVLNIFERHRIDDLVVVNADNQPVGIVDGQDIARLRLV
ncbi:KpsF/GutQ family sugar-phosphate isomerase [Verrucomicrobia bacterium LW23]|nr:KpsF/GutQ family sugar-phosphate isomerase [Verrucomicrobia bacterium LW23]